MDLNELVQQFGFSKALSAALTTAELTTLSAIEAYYHQHGSFIQLLGFDGEMEDKILDVLTVAKIQREMSAALQTPTTSIQFPQLTQRVQSSAVEISDVVYDPDLKDLSIRFGLSVRAVNVCEAGDLNRLSEVRRFNARHKGFRKLRNCGGKTELELRAMLKLADQERVDRLENSSPALESEQLELVFQSLLAKLSKRAHTVLLSLVTVADANSVSRFFLGEGGRMSGATWAGNTVLDELRSMRVNMLSVMPSGVSGEEHQDPAERPPNILVFWAQRHGVPLHLLETLKADTDQMHVLTFLDRYLSLVSIGSWERIQRLYLEEEWYSRTLAEIGERMGFTRSRIQQILSSLDGQLPKKLACIADLPGIGNDFTSLVPAAPVFMATADITRVLNNREGTHWSPLFMLYLAQVLNGSRYIRCYWTKLFGLSERSKELDREMPVMVDHDLEPMLTTMVRSLAKQYDQKRRKSLVVDLRSSYRTSENDFRRRLEAALQLLIANRYPEVKFDNGIVELPPNQKLKREDQLEEVLTEIDAPSHVTVILELWHKHFPDDVISAEIIRSIVVRQKSRFFSIGRTSTYGMLRWEAERENMKGGTIRDLIEDQLRESSDPLHIAQLTLGLQRFRPGTSVKSVKTNLHLDQTGRFTFFPNGFIGLTKKDYSTDPIQSPNGTLFRRSVLAKYVGRPLSELVDYIVSRSKAKRALVDAKVQLLILGRRLIVSPSGMVLHASSEERDRSEPERTNGELPFDQA
jgi:hypothetical protein